MAFVIYHKLKIPTEGCKKLRQVYRRISHEARVHVKKKKKKKPISYSTLKILIYTVLTGPYTCSQDLVTKIKSTKLKLS